VTSFWETTWNTPFRLGWMLKSALLQTGRHADVIYPLFLILLLSGVLSPSPAQPASGEGVMLLWQGLCMLTTLTLMTGWMQVLHARTWLFMLEEAQKHPKEVLLSTPRVPFADFVAPPKEGDEAKNETPPTAWMNPLQRSEADQTAVQEASKLEHPAFLRPTITPMFQGIGRFWGRSFAINAIQGIAFAVAVLLPFFLIYKTYGVPDLFAQATPESLEKLSNLSSDQMQALLLKQPSAQITLISQWMMGLCLSMISAFLVFLATALWWVTMLVSDASIGRALILQWRFFRHDYLRAVFIATAQVGLLGFFVMYPLAHSGNMWVNMILNVGLFFGFLSSTHLAFIYVYSVVQPPFLTKALRDGILKKASTLDAIA
jgi:hypothetical protein